MMNQAWGVKSRLKICVLGCLVFITSSNAPTHSICALTLSQAGGQCLSPPECQSSCTTLTASLPYLLAKDLSLTKTVPNSRSRYFFHVCNVNCLWICSISTFILTPRTDPTLSGCSPQRSWCPCSRWLQEEICANPHMSAEAFGGRQTRSPLPFCA